jgi:MFS family permease
MSVGARVSPLRERSFRLLWLGRTTSELGSGLVPIAFSFAVLDLTGSASGLGLVLAIGFSSRIAVLPLGGLIADRFPRDRVMVAADATRACTQGVVAILLLLGNAAVWELLVLFAAYGAADAFFTPASTGIVASTVRGGQLQAANALLSASRSAASVAGPALGGILVATMPIGTVFAIDASSFLVSCGSLIVLGLARMTTVARGAGVLAELRSGWRELTCRRWLFSGVVFFGISNLAIAPFYVLGPLVARNALGGATSWGLIMASAGAGSLAGDAVAVAARPRRTLTTGFLTLSTWALAPALMAGHVPLAAICVFAALGFGAMSFSNTMWLTTLQEQVPTGQLGRVSAYDWLGSRLLRPVGYILAGPAGGAFGVGATLVGGAALHASASVAVALIPSVRRVGMTELDSR